MRNWTDETGQDHRITFTQTHKMYRINGYCDCSWSVEDLVLTSFHNLENAKNYLEGLHKEFVTGTVWWEGK
jgi:predicted adenine nucleotide alpha hydrolase (AANH) superfamily ATPase